MRIEQINCLNNNDRNSNVPFSSAVEAKLSEPENAVKDVSKLQWVWNETVKGTITVKCIKFTK